MSLLEKITAFTEILRSDHQFKIGVGEVLDALRSLEIVGVWQSQVLFQSALRVVLCAKFEDIVIFDAAFQAFFFPERFGVRQSLLPLDERKASV
ncbi:MAG: hypothetical protein RLZZ156_2225, partial [Deinococcota bacterium]